MNVFFTSVAVTSIIGMPNALIEPRMPTHTPYEAIALADCEPTGTSTKIALAFLAIGIATSQIC